MTVERVVELSVKGEGAGSTRSAPEGIDHARTHPVAVSDITGDHRRLGASSTAGFHAPRTSANLPIGICSTVWKAVVASRRSVLAERSGRWTIEVSPCHRPTDSLG